MSPKFRTLNVSISCRPQAPKFIQEIKDNWNRPVCVEEIEIGI
jgi:hypothetical protein